MKKRCKGTHCTVMLDTGDKYCPRCKQKAEAKYKLYNAFYERGRAVRDATFQTFYKSAVWRAFRLTVLAKHPVCQKCQKAFATICHHVIPLKVAWDKRLDESNICAWCSPCHSAYELRERTQKRGTK